MVPFSGDVVPYGAVSDLLWLQFYKNLSKGLKDIVWKSDVETTGPAPAK